MTLLLIVANVWIFLLELSQGPALNHMILVLGVVPARYTAPHLLHHAALGGSFIPLLAALFLHGGWLHLLGNMLFLFVFGRSIEDRFGHLKFLAMYLLAGLGGNLLHILLNPASRVPTIGASGAIAGILGAYFVTFPAARITTLIPLFIFFWTVELPALLLLGYWFLIQFFTGFQMLAIQSATGGGVAWWGHVGGFLVGLLLALVFQPRSRRRIIEVP
jgi:membrane associated rhomboid family serine protease